jgi:type IV secretory pathway VirB9-like protein
MNMRRRAAGASLLVLTLIAPTNPVDAQTGVREVAATERGVIPLQTRLRYTTMIVLPEGEEILDVICGDKDFWIVSSTHNIAHVKPAKEGAATNLNLVTRSGAIYSFMLTEKAAPPDLKLYVDSGDLEPASKPKYFTAAEVEVLQLQLVDARVALKEAEHKAVEAVAGFKQQYPTHLQFPYAPIKYEKPFFVRSLWHDGEFTYLKSDATELPALYEVKDGKPALVNFQVREGTYVVPKVLDRGYLALGAQRLNFEQRGR